MSTSISRNPFQLPEPLFQHLGQQSQSTTERDRPFPPLHSTLGNHLKTGQWLSLQNRQRTTFGGQGFLLPSPHVRQARFGFPDFKIARPSASGFSVFSICHRTSEKISRRDRL